MRCDAMRCDDMKGLLKSLFYFIVIVAAVLLFRSFAVRTLNASFQQTTHTCTHGSSLMCVPPYNIFLTNTPATLANHWPLTGNPFFFFRFCFCLLLFHDCNCCSAGQHNTYMKCVYKCECEILNLIRSTALILSYRFIKTQ